MISGLLILLLYALGVANGYRNLEVLNQKLASLGYEINLSGSLLLTLGWPVDVLIYLLTRGEEEEETSNE